MPVLRRTGTGGGVSAAGAGIQNFMGIVCTVAYDLGIGLIRLVIRDNG